MSGIDTIRYGILGTIHETIQGTDEWYNLYIIFSKGSV